MRADVELIGIGLYTAVEASRLIGVPVRHIRRWLCGYHYIVHGGERRWVDPLWTPQVPRFCSSVELGFRDLIELRFVASFLAHGLSLQSVRGALKAARHILGEDRPFATRAFKTDGERIFLQLAEETQDPRLLDLQQSQYAFNRLVEPSFRDLDFEYGVAARWWPIPGGKTVVIDPQRAFGQPIDFAYGVPTAALANAAKVEGSIKAAAKIFAVPPEVVRHAVKFEDRLAA